MPNNDQPQPYRPFDPRSSNPPTQPDWPETPSQGYNTPYPSPASNFINNSGQGVDVPAEIASLRWNWGAFGGGWLWCLFNGVRGWAFILLAVAAARVLIDIALPHQAHALNRPLTLIIGLLSSYLGANGHKIAWRSRHFPGGLEQFFAVQRAWSLWTIWVTILSIPIVIYVFILILNTPTPAAPPSPTVPAADRPVDSPTVAPQVMQPAVPQYQNVPNVPRTYGTSPGMRGIPNRTTRYEIDTRGHLYRIDPNGTMTLMNPNVQNPPPNTIAPGNGVPTPDQSSPPADATGSPGNAPVQNTPTPGDPNAQPTPGAGGTPPNPAPPVSDGNGQPTPQPPSTVDPTNTQPAQTQPPGANPPATQ